MPARENIWVQASSSQASAASSHETWFWAKPSSNRLRSPVSFVPDPVLAAGPPAVPQLEVGELAFPGVGGDGGEPVAVEVGEPQLGSGVRRSLRTMTRIPAGRRKGRAAR